MASIATSALFTETAVLETARNLATTIGPSTAGIIITPTRHLPRISCEALVSVGVGV